MVPRATWSKGPVLNYQLFSQCRVLWRETGLERSVPLATDITMPTDGGMRSIGFI